MQGAKTFLKRSNVIAALNTYAKAAVQERTVRKTQHRYLARARSEGIDVPEGARLIKAVRTRLADRAVCRRWPRDKGKLHLFLAFGAKNWETVLPKALSPFGRVSPFEWRSRGFSDIRPTWLARRDEMNRAMFGAFEEAQKIEPIDVVIGYLSGHNTAPETLAKMAEAGAVIVNFSFDDKLHFPGPVVGGRYASPAALAHVVDLNLTSDPGATIRYAVHGGLAMFHPEAADPEVHRPYDQQFEHDVSFVGACYGWRPRFIRDLGERGINVECFGEGWPNGPVEVSEMARIYSRSRINLGFGGIGHSRKLVCLKGRDFEVPMSGGLYLTQHNPELSLVYRVGEEILTYRNATDCAHTIRQLLTNDRSPAAIRLAGRERCLRDHTYVARWTNVFAVLGALVSETGSLEHAAAVR
jgi:hypothetical protein